MNPPSYHDISNYAKMVAIPSCHEELSGDCVPLDNYNGLACEVHAAYGYVAIYGNNLKHSLPSLADRPANALSCATETHSQEEEVLESLSGPPGL